MAALVEAVRQVLNLIAAAEWEILERLTPGSPVTVADLERVVREYGRTLVTAPQDLEPYIDMIDAPESISISVPLWTKEEGRSDLELRLSAREILDGLWQLQVDDVLVP